MKSICPVCGCERVKVTGLVCPNGHGKIVPLTKHDRMGRPKTVTKIAVLDGVSNVPLDHGLKLYKLLGDGARLPGLYRKKPRCRWEERDGNRLRCRWRGVTVSARIGNRVELFVKVEDEK